MPLPATGHPRDEDKSKSLLTNSEEVSDRHIWSEIRYLDPARSSQNNGGPSVVPVIVHLLTWGIVLAALLSLVI